MTNDKEIDGMAKIQGQELKKFDDFKYLGSTVKRSGGTEKEIKKLI